MLINKNIAKKPQLIFNEKNDFFVYTIEHNEKNTEIYQHQLKTDFIQFYFCLKGSLSLIFNTPQCSLTLDAYKSSFAYFKEIPFNLYFKTLPQTKFVFILISVQSFHKLFSKETVNLPIFQNFNRDKPIIESSAISTIIGNNIDQLLNLPFNSSFLPLFIKGKVYEIMSYYFNDSINLTIDTCPFISNSDDVAKIKDVKEILISKMDNPPSLEKLSKEVGLNIKKLKIGFKELYGMPPFTYLYHYKMEHSRKLLDLKNLNINEIAIEIGYSSAAHFIAAFKRKFGITPKQYSLSKI